MQLFSLVGLDAAAEVLQVAKQGQQGQPGELKLVLHTLGLGSSHEDTGHNADRPAVAVDGKLGAAASRLQCLQSTVAVAGCAPETTQQRAARSGKLLNQALLNRAFTEQ